MLVHARLPSIAVWFTLAAALCAAPALAHDTGNGSKNFHVPTAVPNYFSNEAGPMLGGAAESRRGELYIGQGNPQQHQVAAIPVPARAPQRVAVAQSRSHDTREVRRGGRLVHVAHVRPGVHRVAAHVSATRRGATPVSARTTRVGSNHRHGRG